MLRAPWLCDFWFVLAAEDLRNAPNQISEYNDRNHRAQKSIYLTKRGNPPGWERRSAVRVWGQWCDERVKICGSLSEQILWRSKVKAETVSILFAAGATQREDHSGSSLWGSEIQTQQSDTRRSPQDAGPSVDTDHVIYVFLHVPVATQFQPWWTTFVFSFNFKYSWFCEYRMFLYMMMLRTGTECLTVCLHWCKIEQIELGSTQNVSWSHCI